MNILDNIDRDLAGKILDPTKWYGGLFYALLFLFIAFVFSKMLKRVTRRLLLQRGRLGIVDPTLLSFSGDLGQAAVYVFFTLLYLHLIPLFHNVGTALLTGVSVVSVVVGLAAQSALSNLIAGFALLMYRPFRLGDLVELAVPGGTAKGTVESLTLGYTVLLIEDGRKIVVPNSQLSSQTIIVHPAKERVPIGA